MPVTGRDGVRVVVERGGLPLMIKPLRHDRKRDTGLQQFSRHEMPKVVQTKPAQPGTIERPKEYFVARFGFHAVTPSSSLNK